MLTTQQPVLLLRMSYTGLEVQALRNVALLAIQGLLLGLHEVLLCHAHASLAEGQQTSLRTDGLLARDRSVYRWSAQRRKRLAGLVECHEHSEGLI
jgi:hypothetical protein